MNRLIVTLESEHPDDCEESLAEALEYLAGEVRGLGLGDGGIHGIYASSELARWRLQVEPMTP
jgi:hypothetical protein